MRIVQIAQDVYPVPHYAGTEMLVYILTEMLVKKGHEVYLYAPEGSDSSAKIINYKKKNQTVDEVIDYIIDTMPKNVDIVHDNSHTLINSTRKLPYPAINTIHWPDNAKTDFSVYVSKRYKEIFGNNKGFFVYNGIDVNDFQFSCKKLNYNLYLGRICNEKGVHHAITISEKNDEYLLIAGPIYDQNYYRTEIEPRIRNNKKIMYLGFIEGLEKQCILKNAKCVLFTSIYEDNCPLTILEALACGTPVLGFHYGGVPELLENFPELLCNSVDEMAYKCKNNLFPNSYLLRNYVMNKFSSDTMTEKYLFIYQLAINAFNSLT